MRKLALSVVCVGTLVMGALLAIGDAPVFGDPVVQRAVVNFLEPVRVQNRFLVGTYVVEHDEGRMARGEPCTKIYKGGDPARLGDEVVAFSCVHRDRRLTSKGIAVVNPGFGASGIKDLREFQFPGSAAGHGVPR